MEIELKLEDLKKAMPDDGDGYIEPAAMFRFFTDLFNDAGLDSELIYQDTDYSISVNGVRMYVDVMSDDLLHAFIMVAQQLADELNSSSKFRAWVSYKKGKYYLVIEDRTPVNEE